jgi:hypothetical protein
MPEGKRSFFFPFSIFSISLRSCVFFLLLFVFPFYLLSLFTLLKIYIFYYFSLFLFLSSLFFFLSKLPLSSFPFLFSYFYIFYFYTFSCLSSISICFPILPVVLVYSAQTLHFLLLFSFSFPLLSLLFISF